MLEDLLRRLIGDAGATSIGAPQDQGEPDEVRTIRVKYRNDAGQEMITPTVRAEVRRKAVFGFSPRRHRLEVCFRLAADADLLPPAGISLLEGDQLHGTEAGWKCRWAEEGESEYIYWLEEG